MAVLPVLLPDEPVVRGATLEPTYEVRDRDGVLIDLTMVGIDVRFRAQQGSGTVVERSKINGVLTGLTVTDQGRLTPAFTAADTQAWTTSPDHFVRFEIVIDVNGKRVYQAHGRYRMVEPDTGDIA